MRVDAQLLRDVKRVVTETRKHSRYHEYNQSEALRYLLKLGLAAYADGLEIDDRGRLVRRGDGD